MGKEVRLSYSNSRTHSKVIELPEGKTIDDIYGYRMKHMNLKMSDRIQVFFTGMEDPISLKVKDLDFDHSHVVNVSVFDYKSSRRRDL